MSWDVTSTPPLCSACMPRAECQALFKAARQQVSPVFNDTQPAPVKQPLRSSARLLRGSCSRSLKLRPSTCSAWHSALNRERPHVRARGIPASLRAYLGAVAAPSDPRGSQWTLFILTACMSDAETISHGTTQQREVNRTQQHLGLGIVNANRTSESSSLDKGKSPRPSPWSSRV